MTRDSEERQPGTAPEQDWDHFLVEHLATLNTYVRVRMGRALRAKESVSDLVQSTCREVLRSGPDLEQLDEEARKLWLFRATERKILKKVRHWRTAKRDPSKEEHGGSRFSEIDASQLAPLSAPFRSPSGEAILQEELTRLEDAFCQLPPDYREVITLFHLVGLSHARIAKEMNRSPEAVRMLLVRALARLARILGQ